MGYVRLFFLDSEIRKIINKPLYYKGFMKFILVSGKNKFIAVSDKDFLKGEDINAGNRLENRFYNEAINSE